MRCIMCWRRWAGWLVLIPWAAAAQQSLEIVHADRFRRTRWEGQPVEVLVGNVVLRHDSVELRADSIRRRLDVRQVEGWGRVRITAHDTVVITADSFHYDAADRTGLLEGEVVLQTPTMAARSSKAVFSMAHRTVVLPTEYEVRHPRFRLTARWGRLHMPTSHFTARSDVVVHLDEGTVHTDTMDYFHAPRKVAFPRGGCMAGEGAQMEFGRGMYWLAARKGAYAGGVRMGSESAGARADSVSVDDSAGWSTWYGAVRWVQQGGAVALGDSARVRGRFRSGRLEGRVALMVPAEAGSDTLWLRTQRLMWRSGGRIWWAVPRVQVVVDSLGVVADSVWGDTSVPVWRLFPVTFRYADFVGVADSAAWYPRTDRLVLYDSVWVRQAMPLAPLARQIQAQVGLLEGDARRPFRWGRFRGRVMAMEFLLDDSNRLVGRVVTVADSAEMQFGEVRRLERLTFYPTPRLTVFPPPTQPREELFLPYARPVRQLPPVSPPAILSAEELVLLRKGWEGVPVECNPPSSP